MNNKKEWCEKFMVNNINECITEMSEDSTLTFSFIETEGKFIYTIESENDEKFKGSKFFESLKNCYMYILGQYDSLFWEDYKNKYERRRYK